MAEIFVTNIALNEDLCMDIYEYQFIVHAALWFIYVFIYWNFFTTILQDLLAILRGFYERPTDQHKKHQGFKQGHSIISVDQHIFATFISI